MPVRSAEKLRSFLSRRSGCLFVISVKEGDRYVFIPILSHAWFFDKDKEYPTGKQHNGHYNDELKNKIRNEIITDIEI